MNIWYHATLSSKVYDTLYINSVYISPLLFLLFF